MDETTTTVEREWAEGWEGHERAQRERLSLLPLTDMLEWLEHAHRVVRHMQDRVADEASKQQPG
jgi:hypothetical protein